MTLTGYESERYVIAAAVHGQVGQRRQKWYSVLTYCCAQWLIQLGRQLH